MYRIVACDLDETLLGMDKQIGAKNIEAIKALKEAGGWFVPATGRGYVTVDGTLKELGLDEPGQYVISFNGGAITENGEHKLIHYEGLPFEMAEELYLRGQKYDVGIHVYTKETVYGYNLSDLERSNLRGRQEIVEIDNTDLDFLKGQEIVKVLYMNPDYDYLFTIEPDMADLEDRLDISYSSGRYIEFNHKGVSKGEGLLKLAELLGVDPADTIAIGDNFNDLSMIKTAGLGAGVANTVEEMKKNCDFITEADCDNGAVAEVIERFILDPLQEEAEA